MLPPALGGLRVLRAAGPRPSCTREYGKDQVVMRSPARHCNYTKPRFIMASAGFLKFFASSDWFETIANGLHFHYGLTVCYHLLVVRNQQKSIAACLSYEHPIKWI